MGDDTKIVMQVPQDVIAAQVQAAIAGVLKDRGEDLMVALVREAIEMPARDNYGRDITRYENGKHRPVTRFRTVLEKGITEAADAEVRVWIEEQKDAIKKAVRAHLGRTKKDVVASIADQIVNQLAAPRVSLRMSFGADD